MSRWCAVLLIFPTQMYACSLEIMCAGYYKLLITSLTAAEISSRCKMLLPFVGQGPRARLSDPGINGLSVSVKTRKQGVCLKVSTKLGCSHLSKLS